ncbi:Uncharacterised protein [Salmonella enterica subsp. enterica]|nr:Uncharacterised protein [Salmonella enterica subsp. enterica]
MIPYITLALIVGTSLGFIAHRHLVKQQLKTKSMRIGKRVYRVVHETGVSK